MTILRPTKNETPRIGFISLGCPKNLVDSERILTQLRGEGYDIVNRYDTADVVIVNTCGFIDSAVEESLATIGEALDENGRVIVTGCLGVKAQTIREVHPNVLAVTGPHAYEAVLEQVREHLPRPAHNPFEHLVPDHGIKLTPRHYAYLKISEGCNHRCTFCIIPSLRGDLVSRPIGEVLDEAQRLKAAGVRELLVISQDTSAYGVDVKNRTGFWQGKPVKTAMSELCHELAAMDIWVRLHYVYPYPSVDRVIPLMATGQILPYLDIPLQHASPRILKAMRRPAAAEKTKERIRQWREQCPELVLRSTFIVGFPGESDDDFQELLDFLDEVQLDRVGCFMYSAVDGARANQLPDAVPDALKRERHARFMEKQRQISAERLSARIGLEYQVLIDELTPEGAVGRSYAEAPQIDGKVYLTDEFDVEPGERIWAEVIHSDDHDVWAVRSDDED